MRNVISLVIALLLITSCSSLRRSGKVEIPVHTDNNIRRYVSEYAELAMQEMRRTGIPASITLAQGIVESDYGRSRLARKANNHFGIKCHSDWKGKKIYHDDDRRNECFRSYRRVSESYRDHSDFLLNGSRYAFLFDLEPDDYSSWARGLKRAGYATNPRYARMLIDMIRDNNLDAYDRLVIRGKAFSLPVAVTHDEERVNNEEAHVNAEDNEQFVINKKSRIKVRNRIQYIIVEEDDTYRSISDEFEMMKWELKKYNELEEKAKIRAGQVLYLQPKRNKAEPGLDFHITKQGETMYSISQLYGIKLKALYRKNRMEVGTEPAPGTEIWLRKTKPEGL
ncbi:MAG: glucosaminidase domain-containing protein [Bacteroidales bacterium]|nr:glucosaminidase domain-containing protein [Bacteroidales bacterium]